jgi:hypothetical protein
MKLQVSFLGSLVLFAACSSTTGTANDSQVKDPGTDVDRSDPATCVTTCQSINAECGTSDDCNALCSKLTAGTIDCLHDAHCDQARGLSCLTGAGGSASTSGGAGSSSSSGGSSSSSSSSGAVACNEGVDTQAMRIELDPAFDWVGTQTYVALSLSSPGMAPQSPILGGGAGQGKLAYDFTSTNCERKVHLVIKGDVPGDVPVCEGVFDFADVHTLVVPAIEVKSTTPRSCVVRSPYKT